MTRNSVQAVRSMYIQVQQTPNPLSLKFLPGQQLLPDASKTYDFSSAATAKQSPLTVKLLRIDGVKRVFFGEDFVTVTKSDEQVDWALLRPEIFFTIADHLQAGEPVINEESTSSGATEEVDNEVVKTIKEILETRIRPMVQEDGGDITYVGFDDGVVKLKMQGSCTGCPSSGVTLKNGIENMLTFYVPEVKEVIEVKDESDDLVEREFKLMRSHSQMQADASDVVEKYHVLLSEYKPNESTSIDIKLKYVWFITFKLWQKIDTGSGLKCVIWHLNLSKGSGRRPTTHFNRHHDRRCPACLFAERKEGVECAECNKLEKNIFYDVNVWKSQQQEQQQHVYFVEVIALDSEDETSVIYQDWCYGTNCNVSISAFFDSEFHIRVTTFDDDGTVGRPVLSRWYDVEKILSSKSNSMKLKNVEWNDDKAAARFEIDHDDIPMCSSQIEYKNMLSSEYKTVDFYLDHTREILIENLYFNQNYSARLVNQSSDLFEIKVPSCKDMMEDILMCGPSPVPVLSSYWNNTHESRLIIDWTYFSPLDQSIDVTNDDAIRTSHFQFSVHPLITTDNGKCEKYEAMRRDVPFTYRKFIFNVPDATCNYEVEVTVFDTKRRKSESKKMKVIRINEPSAYMSLLPSEHLRTSIGLIILLVFFLLSIFLIILFFYLKRKNQLKKRKRLENNRNVMYAYVDEATRNIVGVKQSGGRFVPIPSSNSDAETALTQLVYNNTIPDGNKGEMFHYPIDVETPQPYGDFGAENPYDYIMDFHVGSEFSADVFEEDICLSTPSIRKSPVYSPMPPIAPFDDFDTLPAYAHRNFRFGKSYESEGSAFCRMKTAVDVSRGVCFSLKYPKDYSIASQQALRIELEILRTLPFHPNCVRFDGVIIGRWENIPFQITAILMEDCRGGSLHNYISTVGSELRRREMRTPDDPTLPLPDGSPNLSSGYESFTSKGRQTPDGQSDLERVSSAFCRFAEQISGALEHLHLAGILHTKVSAISAYLSLDYKDPLDDMLTNQTVKLGDFGSSSRSHSNIYIIESTLQPPEVVLGKKFESKGDVWQFGVFLVEMATLGDPYQGKKDIPTSQIRTFDKLKPTQVLREAAKKCLELRCRPSAADLHKLFLNRALHS